MRCESEIASTPNWDKTPGTDWPHHGNRDHIPGNGGQATGVESDEETRPAVLDDQATLAYLYASYAPSIYNHCCKFLRSAAEARDATQETFVRVLSRGIVVTCEKAAIGYLYRTSTNICLNILSKQKMEMRAAAVLALNTPYVRWSEFADREFILALLARSGEDQAQVAIMHYVEGMSQIEIADVLGITRKTVFNRLRRMALIARQLLRHGGQAPIAQP